MDADQLRRRLERILRHTEGAQNVAVPGWWGERNADERRTMDDLRAGRLNWRAAHSDALQGLEALDRGEHEMAETLLWAALDHYIAALESRIEPKDIEVLSTSAGRRDGAPAKADRDAQIVAAVEAQRARGLRGSQAIAAAKRAAPDTFAGIGVKRVQNILATARKNLPGM